MLDFATLYAEHARDVHRFALFLSGDPALAEDLRPRPGSRRLGEHGSRAEPHRRQRDQGLAHPLALQRQSPKSWKPAQKKGAEASISSGWPLAVVIRIGWRINSLCAAFQHSGIRSLEFT